jgi:diguanylate cyclase (GGDEF)-like protein/PAS domain S-box-containing protein
MESLRTADRLGVLESLGVGYLVQYEDGTIVEANGPAREYLAMGLLPGPVRATGGPSLRMEPRCVDVTGVPLPTEAHPVHRVMRTGGSVRGVTLGIEPGTPRARWVRMDCGRITVAGTGRDAVATVVTDVTAETELTRESAVAADRATRLMAPVRDVVCRLDARDRFLDVSDSCLRVLGTPAEDLFGRGAGGLVHAEGAEEFRSALTRARITGTGQAQLRMRRGDGELRWVDISVHRVDPVAGRPEPGTELHLLLRDVHDRVLAEQERAEVDHRYHVLAENTGELVCVLDPRSRFVYVSPSVEPMLGHRPGDLVGTAVDGLVHPEEAAEMRQVLESVGQGTPRRLRHRWRTSGDDWIWVETGWRPVPGKDGAVQEIRLSSRGIADRLSDQEAVHVARESVRLTVAAAGHAMARTDPDGRILQVNDALVALVRRSVRELQGQMLRTLVPAQDPDPAAVLRGPGPGQERDELRREQRLLRGDGSVVWVDLKLSAVRNRTGAVRELLATIVDLTAQRVFGERLRGLDRHDPLTATGTPEVLRDRMTGYLADPRVTRLALVRADLDGFRRLNEVKGRRACDTALVVTADRLRQAVREADLVARIGADEFAVLCPGVDRRYVERLGQRINRALTGTVPGLGSVGASVGVATARPGDSAQDVLARAEAAMSVVRRSGGGGWAVD